MKEKKDTLPRKRSPQCPSMSLPDALKRTAKAYKKELRHASSADIIAKHMGYSSSKGGASATAIASITYFGLLTRPAGGMLSVSKSFEDYKYSPTDDLKKDLLVTWLRSPKIYAELLDKYQDDLPSTDTLTFDFIQKGFNSNKAKSYVLSFIESVEFTDYYNKRKETPEDTQDIEEEENDTKPQKPSESPLSKNKEGNTSLSNIETPEDYISIPIRLSNKRQATLIIPVPFYESDKEALKAHIDLQYTDTEEKETTI